MYANKKHKGESWSSRSCGGGTGLGAAFRNSSGGARGSREDSKGSSDGGGRFPFFSADSSTRRSGGGPGSRGGRGGGGPKGSGGTGATFADGTTAQQSLNPHHRGSASAYPPYQQNALEVAPGSTNLPSYSTPHHLSHGMAPRGGATPVKRENFAPWASHQYHGWTGGDWGQSHARITGNDDGGSYSSNRGWVSPHLGAAAYQDPRYTDSYNPLVNQPANIEHSAARVSIIRFS